MIYKITGIVFIAMAGFIYTLERGFSLLSTSVIQAGFFSGQMNGEVPDFEINEFSAIFRSSVLNSRNHILNLWVQ